ncbi:cytochrome P450 [Streptomyces sp. NBC_00059]|uniref:cytochrome P450 n=1 Tax=Streptomyces sp. NBC_00059 TaxID=2975635 RepID=UPI002254D707|nr:cytochrome P450 [Streptomyces sp. NBC_00059]MCX5415772.1 cytochrome P450 [Streptomyces sp. NBC_00059]
MTERPTAIELPSYQDGGADLWAYLRELRHQGPVFQDERTGVFHLFGYEEVQRALLDTAAFRSDMSEIMPLQTFGKGNLVQTDPPRHRELRTLLNEAFAARTKTLLDSRIAEIIHELLDQISDQDSFDLTEQLTYPLPITVIAELLGVPGSDRGLFRKWADDMFSLSFDTAFDPELPKAIDAAAKPMIEYLHEHVRNRRKNRREDLISDLVAARVDGNGLDDEEAVSFSAILLLAGHITTTLMLGNAVISLDENPAVNSALRADRSGFGGFIEEVLRCRTPFTQLTRMTNKAVEFDGTTIPAGRMVALWLAAANRDENRFAEPDRFDPLRQPNQHLSFGHGIHFCLGGPLARLETKIALDILFDEFTEIRLDPTQKPEFFAAPGALGPRRLPVVVKRA